MRLTIVMLSTASLGTPYGMAGPITLEFGPELGAPETEVELTDQLQEFGVTFSSTSEQGVLWLGEDPTIGSYSYCINAGWEGGFGAVDPIRVDFSPFVTEASIRAFDGGGDIDTLILQAFDADDNVLDFEMLSASFASPGLTATVTGSEIAYITFEVTDTHSGLFFDDLTYTFVPAPAAAAPFVMFLVASGRRRRHDRREV